MAREVRPPSVSKAQVPSPRRQSSAELKAAGYGRKQRALAPAATHSATSLTASWSRVDRSSRMVVCTKTGGATKAGDNHEPTNGPNESDTAESVRRRRPARRLRRPAQYTISSDEEGDSSLCSASSYNYSTDSLVDFIVADSASETELRRGRTPRSKASKASKSSSTRMTSVNSKIDNSTASATDRDNLGSPTKDRKHNDPSDALRPLQSLSINLPPPRSTAFETLDSGLVKTTPPRLSPQKADRALRLSTPPASPSKPKLASPSKSHARVPLSPHRQSLDAFWSQDVINEWNEQYSPRKTPSTRRFGAVRDASPSGSPRKSPLKSPGKRDKAAVARRQAFNTARASIAEEFLHELDETVTDGQLAVLAAATGGVRIVWSKKLNSTAGRANWKRESNKQSSPNKLAGEIEVKHHAYIELAEKVIDDEDRLLNVIAHEFCHLANFMISNVKDQPHGRSFQQWAQKVTSGFAHKNINVTTKHSYTIDYKYIWACTACEAEYQRHSKSIDPSRHACGRCKAKLVQIQPAPRTIANSADPSSPQKEHNISYQAFVKQWYRVVQREQPDWAMGAIMAEVARRYRVEKETRAMKKQARSDSTSTALESTLPTLSEVPTLPSTGRSCSEDRESSQPSEADEMINQMEKLVLEGRMKTNSGGMMKLVK